jgi:hypothetical protein
MAYALGNYPIGILKESLQKYPIDIVFVIFL